MNAVADWNSPEIVEIRELAARCASAPQPKPENRGWDNPIIREFRESKGWFNDEDLKRGVRETRANTFALWSVRQLQLEASQDALIAEYAPRLPFLARVEILVRALLSYAGKCVSYGLPMCYSVKVQSWSNEVLNNGLPKWYVV